MAPSKVTKKRSDSTKQQHPIQYWDGKTYACLACKRGHRVKLCDHGKDGKLVSATNQPGRPSSGSDRKCTCPKSCKCTSNCKCVKDGCICVQRMFLVVALKSSPKPVWVNQDPEPIPQWTDENGEEKTLNPVYTDLNGNALSPEEAKAREEERERRRNDGSANTHKPGCCSSKQPKEETSPTPTSGCRHRDTIPQTPAPETTRIASPGTAANQCTCGVKCQCTLCPEHPNNTATRQYNAQQLNAMASNPGGSYMPTQSMINGQSFKPEVAQGSCLGGEASYFLTREQPTLHDFQRLFPDYAPGDFVLTYPMDAPTHTYNQMNNMSLPPDDAYVTQMPMSIDPLAEFQHFESNAFDDMAFMDQPLNFTFGDADVTTFGSQPLPSPNILQSPTHLPLCHQRNDSGPPEAQKCAHIIPPDRPTSQTINPNVFQPRISYSSQAQTTLQSAPSSTPTENTNQHLFFQPTLTTPPKNTRFDMSAPLPNFPSAQALKYRPPHPLTNPLSSPGP